MRRTLLILCTVLSPMLLAPPAFAMGPTREVHTQGDAVISDQCAFPVLAHITGVEVITTFTDRSGDPVKQIAAFPGNRITLTNFESGTSITIMGTGSSQLRVTADGSLSARAMGHGPFFPNPITGAPGIWYLSGQGKATIDPLGNVTSAELAGRLVDLCPRLAT
jgi:hypothetical protein